MNRVGSVGYGGAGPYVMTNAMNQAPGSVLARVVTQVLSPARAATAAFALASTPTAAGAFADGTEVESSELGVVLCFVAIPIGFGSAMAAISMGNSSPVACVLGLVGLTLATCSPLLTPFELQEDFMLGIGIGSLSLASVSWLFNLRTWLLRRYDYSFFNVIR